MRPRTGIGFALGQPYGSSENGDTGDEVATSQAAGLSNVQFRKESFFMGEPIVGTMFSAN